MSTPPAPQPKPALRVFDAVMITVGIVIGAGIFKAPAQVAGLAGSVEWMLIAWLAGGLLSLVGALCYAELASSHPSTGGDYRFLRVAFGRDVAFLFAWARITVITTGSIALLAFVFGDYATRVLPLGPASSAIYACGIVVLMTLVNLGGLRRASLAQNGLTLLEIGGVALVILAGFWIGLSATGAADAATAIDAGAATEPGMGGLPAMFGLMMVFVLLTFGGWNEAAYVSAEVRGGPRRIVGTLVWSLLVITVLYVLTVTAMTAALGFDALGASQAPAADVLEKLWGERGAQLIGLVVAIAAITSMNATMIVGARTNHALGEDWPRLAPLASWDDQRNVPRTGFLVQGLIALALVGAGTMERSGFAAMVEFTAPVFWFFFMLTGIALIVLRVREADAARPFRVPLFPLTPIVFVATCAYLLWSSLTYAQSQNATAIALWVMAAGVLALIVLRIASIRRARS